MASVYESCVLDGLELNDGTVFAAAEINFPPPPALVEWVRSADSDGSLLAREPPHDNAEGTIRLWVAQQATSDLMLAKVALITDKLQEAQRNPGGIDLVWTPHDSILSVTGKVLFGEIGEMPLSFEAGWIGNAPTVTIKLTRLPFWEGVEITDLTDDFSTNTITNYTLDAGTGTISVSGGVLVPSSTAEKRLIHTSSLVAPTDSWTTAKFLTGASVASGTAGVIVKRLDASNYLAAQIAAAGASTRVNVVKVDAGVATTLVQSGTFALSTATNYWVRFRMESNTVTVELFTAVPTFQSTPAQTATVALTGGDITKFGSGIAGRSGIRLIPQATDWRADDFWVQPNTAKSTEPVVTLEVSNVPGDVPAKIRAVVTDGATQSRRIVRAGLESRYYPTSSPPALLVDSASLVTSGFSGSSSTARTGAYSGNGTILSPTLIAQPMAICGLGNLSHVGSFRVFARVVSTSLTVDTAWLRLSWQEGAGPLRSNSWVSPPSFAATFSEIDLGIVTIPPAILGTQRWTGQIEAYATSGAPTVDIDYVYLLPVAEGYGVARAPYAYLPGTITRYDPFTGIVAPTVLNGRIIALGGTWADSGANADWTAADGPTATDETMARTSITDSGREFELFGTSITGSVEVGADVYYDADEVAAPGVVARWTDANNLILLAISNPVLVMYVIVAGVLVASAGGSAPAGVVGEWRRLQLVVYASGQAYGRALTLGGSVVSTCAVAHSSLATGGTIADGKAGLVDYTPSGAAVTRYFDNVTIGVPATEPIACYSTQSIEFREDDMLREDSTGVYWGPPPEPRAGLRGLPPAGTRSRKSRLAIVARRNDITTAADDQVADSTAVQVVMTPRYINAPR